MIYKMARDSGRKSSTTAMMSSLAELPDIGLKQHETYDRKFNW